MIAFLPNTSQTKNHQYFESTVSCQKLPAIAAPSQKCDVRILMILWSNFYMFPISIKYCLHGYQPIHPPLLLFHRSDRCHTRVFIPKSRIWTNYNFQSFLVLIVVYLFTFIFNLEAVTFDQQRHFINWLFPYLSSKRVIGWKSVFVGNSRTAISILDWTTVFSYKFSLKCENADCEKLAGIFAFCTTSTVNGS